MPERVRLEISWASLWRVVFVAAIVFLFFFLKDVVITVLLSVFISTAFSGVVLSLERLKIPRLLATLIIFVSALALLAFILYTIVPIAIIELNSLLNNLDGTIGNVLGPETTAKIRNVISPDLNHLANILLAGSASFFDVIGKLLGGAAYFFTVLILSFYMTVSRDGVQNFIRSIFPSVIEERAVRLYEHTQRKISRWFTGQLFLSFVVSVIVFIGLSLLGVKYALILAIAAGAFEFVPVVGPIFAGALSIVIATTDSVSLGFYVFLLFLIVQQIEANVLVPLMIKKVIDIHPVFVLVALLGGFELAGVPGMVLAVPTAVVVEDLLDDWISKKSKTADEITI